MKKKTMMIAARVIAIAVIIMALMWLRRMQRSPRISFFNRQTLLL